MLKPKSYVGLDNDINGGMTDTGKIIRDAWAFGLIPEDETCKGWLPHQIETLWRAPMLNGGHTAFVSGPCPKPCAPITCAFNPKP